MDIWPNFFIVGAAKSGTTTLYEHLKKIPSIYMSPLKEPNYFSNNWYLQITPNEKITREADYLELFAKVKDETVIGEASTSYFDDPKVPRLIFEKTPNAKILISLRNPIEKIFSRFLMLKRGDVLIDANFHEYVQRILKNSDAQSSFELSIGLYHGHVKKFLDIFGKEKVKIIIFEDWIKDPEPAIIEILKFLRNDFILKDFQNKIYNKYYEIRVPLRQYIRKSSLTMKIVRNFLPLSTRKSLARRLLSKNAKKPTMNICDREELVKFYYDDVQKLKTLLGKELPWCDFN